jgi:DNA invertase Pin-like site-specific DNA recombinase
MPKNVLLYARYSTDRQDQVSIETQVELGTTFNDERGWKLVEVFTDAAVSGTSFKSRPGIQALLKRCEQGGIDIVLCVTLDRISRDVEHSAGILKCLATSISNCGPSMAVAGSRIWRWASGPS